MVGLKSSRMATLAITLLLLNACTVATPSQTPSTGPVLPELTMCGSDICWQGNALAHLTPQTLQDGVRQVDGYADATVQELWSNESTRVYGWSPVGERFVQLVLQDNNPVVLGRALADEVTLGQIIDKFGDPSQIVIRKVPNPEQLLVAIDVVYESLGLVFLSGYIKGHDRFQIAPDLRLETFYLSSERQLDRLLGSTLYGLRRPPEKSLSEIVKGWADTAQQWRGYGTYEVMTLPSNTSP